MIASSCKLTFLGLALCVAIFSIGCREGEAQPDIAFEYKFMPDPPRTGFATFSLRLADAAGKPINGARIDLEGNMSHAGMRPVFSEARELETGRYEAALEFTMRGDWIILVHITLPDGRRLQKELFINGVQSG